MPGITTSGGFLAEAQLRAVLRRCLTAGGGPAPAPPPVAGSAVPAPPRAAGAAVPASTSSPGRFTLPAGWPAGSGTEQLAGMLAGRDLGPLLIRARQHRVLPWVSATLIEQPWLEPSVRTSLVAERAELVFDQMRAAHDLALVAAALAAADVGWLLVKGLALAELVYPEPELRPFHDLDVLVPPGDFARAVLALEDGGARLLDQNWPLIRSEMRGQLHLALPSGRVVDLHWSLLNRGSVRQRFRVETVTAVLRAVPANVAGTGLHTLDPISTLLHLCLHAALSGGDRLIWMKDIDLAVRVLRPDWPEVLDQSARWRARASVGAMLHRARASLDTPVPEDVLRRLLPAPLRLGVAALDRGWPAAADPSRALPLTITSPTLGDRGLRSSPRLRRNLVPRPRSRRAAGPVTVSQQPPDVRQAGREAYLAAVTALGE